MTIYLLGALLAFIITITTFLLNKGDGRYDKYTDGILALTFVVLSLSSWVFVIVRTATSTIKFLRKA